jgi:hypothetical protein
MLLFSPSFCSESCLTFSGRKAWRWGVAWFGMSDTVSGRSLEA